MKSSLKRSIGGEWASKDKRKYQSARKIPPSGKQPLGRLYFESSAGKYLGVKSTFTSRIFGWKYRNCSSTIFQHNIQNRGPNEEIFGAKLLQVLHQMNSLQEREAGGSARQNLTINTSFSLFANLLEIAVFPLCPCLTGNLAYKFRKCTAIVVSHRGRGSTFLKPYERMA